jgi:apyrase
VASAVVTPAGFEKAAKIFCSLSLAEIGERFPKLKELKREYMCLDLVYLYSLLVSGFGIDQNQEITLVKKIMYRGFEVEAAWPLGSAIELVSGYQ